MSPDISKERCNHCRFWREDIHLRDPNDADWGFGDCRRAPPTLVSSMVGAQIERPAYGQQIDIEASTLLRVSATNYPATSSTDWCGLFEGRPKASQVPA